jgi:hypothetical protein
LPDTFFPLKSANEDALQWRRNESLMRYFVLVSMLLAGCSIQQSSEQPEASIASPKPAAEAAPKKEESCLPSPTLLSLVECVSK